MKAYSITRRLIIMVLLVELCSAVCVSGVAYIYERHDHFRAFDILLSGRADSVVGAVQSSDDAQDSLMLDGSEIDIPHDDIYDVRDATNRVLGHSAEVVDFAQAFRPSPSRADKIDPDGDEASFGNVEFHGKAYRVIRVLGVRVIDPGEKGGMRRTVVVYYGSPVHRVWKAIYRAVTFYALSSLVVLAVTGVLMSWLLNRGLAPLRALASGAAAVSVTSWTFDAPASARMTRELSPLVNALESLLLGLQQSFEQQRRFVGDAAHELKTSVAVLKSSLQLLGMKPRSQQEYHAGLERCLLDCQRMEQLVAQMLTLARIEETDAKSAGEHSSDIYACLQDVSSQLVTMAEANEIHLVLVGEDSLYAALDPGQLKLLCTNLLMNAMQHSPSESVVTVKVGKTDGFAEIRFCDAGDGIDAADLPRIFERFSRSDPSRSRNTGGTGLGLAICKAITDKCGGAIKISSEIRNGTTVLVRIPLSRPGRVDAVQPLS